MSRRRLTGYPTSSNRASSFHLFWSCDVLLREVSVTLVVEQPPQVAELYFWALQVSFVDSSGSSGAAHLGLQWHPSYPGSTAVNWGGYDREGRILGGTESALPSTLGNANTRDFRWTPGDAYRLRIFSDRPRWWEGEVSDLASGTVTVVRALEGGGDLLAQPMVWSEVFARCDAPPVAVVWSQPAGLTADGGSWRPTQYSTNYQAESAGGCSNTDSRSLPHGVAQLTAVPRTNPTGTLLGAR